MIDKEHGCRSSIVMKAIFEAYVNNRVTGWGLILDDVVNLEMMKIGRRKGCPLTSFIYHFSATDGLPTAREKEEWEPHQKLVDRKSPLNREDRPEELEKSDEQEAVHLDEEEGQPQPAKPGDEK